MTHPRVFTFTPLPSPLPTFNAEDAGNLISKLLEDNSGCSLPCLWGFTPGDTDYKETVAFMERFGNIADSNSLYVRNSFFEDSHLTSISLMEGNTRIYLEIEVNDREGTLRRTMVFTGASQEDIASYGNPFFQQSLEYFFLPSILAAYGKPSVVLIAPFPDELPYIGDFSMVLYYPDKGFFIQYVFPKDESNGNFIGCPSESAYIDIITWSPQEEYKISEIAKDMSGRGINELNYDYFKPVGEVTTMSLDDFYETFKDPANTTCLETPIKYWK